MYQLMINRKNSKKGFTLVEVIVVLVILAILAAIMIPAMTGWIDRAREKSIIVEGRAALLAAQTIASETYGTKGNVVKTDIGTDDVKTLAGLKGDVSDIEVATDGKGQVTKLTYKNGTNKVIYENGSWTPSTVEATATTTTAP